MHACSPLVNLPFTLSCDAEVPASAFPAPDDSRTCLMMISQGGQSYNLAARRSQDSHNLGRIKLELRGAASRTLRFPIAIRTLTFPEVLFFHDQIGPATSDTSPRETNAST